MAIYLLSPIKKNNLILIYTKRLIYLFEKCSEKSLKLSNSYSLHEVHED